MFTHSGAIMPISQKASVKGTIAHSASNSKPIDQPSALFGSCFIVCLLVIGERGRVCTCKCQHVSVLASSKLLVVLDKNAVNNAPRPASNDVIRMLYALAQG